MCEIPFSQNQAPDRLSASVQQGAGTGFQCRAGRTDIVDQKDGSLSDPACRRRKAEGSRYIGTPLAGGQADLRGCGPTSDQQPLIPGNAKLPGAGACKKRCLIEAALALALGVQRNREHDVCLQMVALVGLSEQLSERVSQLDDTLIFQGVNAGKQDACIAPDSAQSSKC